MNQGLSDFKLCFYDYVPKARVQRGRFKMVLRRYTNYKIRQIHCREWRGSSWLEIRDRGHIFIFSLEKLGRVLSVWGQRRFWGRTFMRRWLKEGLCFMVEQKKNNSVKHKREKEEGLGGLQRKIQWLRVKERVCRGDVFNGNISEWKSLPCMIWHLLLSYKIQEVLGMISFFLASLILLSVRYWNCHPIRKRAFQGHLICPRCFILLYDYSGWGSKQ